MTDDLRARLEGHAKAFEGMMSLIPAKYYYGEDNDDQWQRKKQTKEQKKAARKAKLDPANYKSALDVHKENELKRKRELEEEEGITRPGEDTEQPRQGLKASGKPAKKQKTEAGQDSKDDATSSKPTKPALTPEQDDAIRQEKAEKRRLKRERKKATKQKSAEAKEARKLLKREEKAKKSDGLTANGDTSKPKPKRSKKDKAPLKQTKVATEASLDISQEQERGSSGNEVSDADDNNDLDHDNEDLDETVRFDMDGFGDQSNLDQDADSDSASGSSVSAADTPTFDTFQRHSSASSSSSIIPPSQPEEPQKPVVDSSALQNGLSPKPNPRIPEKLMVDTAVDAADATTPSTSTQTSGEKHPRLPHIDPDLLKERLEARLAALRAARKADGPDGRPAKNRQELIEARRARDERRKQHKKELRNKAKKELDAEAEAARLRGGSGSPMWSPAAVLSPRAEPSNNFSFGKVAFADGAQLDVNLSGVVDAKLKKGPSDVKTAIEAIEKKKGRLNGLDAEKRQNIEEKDMWLNAKKRVQGEKVKDNMSLLKKTLKRKENGKAKSEKEWNERIDGVAKGKEARQRRREDNLKKRRDEKGGGGSSGKKSKAGSAFKPKPRARPGFEGSWRLGTKTS